MLKAFVLLAIVLNCSLEKLEAQVAAQRTKKPVYEASAEGGLVSGPAGPALQLRLMNGIAYKAWFGGLGVGIDQYYHRSVPLFFEVRKQLKKPGNGLYLYAVGGTNLVSRMKDKMDVEEVNYRPGGYWDVGPGYKFHLSGKLFLLLECGYGIKAFRENLYFNYNQPPEPGSVTRNHYTLHNLSARLGLGF